MVLVVLKKKKKQNTFFLSENTIFTSGNKFLVFLLLFLFTSGEKSYLGYQDHS